MQLNASAITYNNPEAPLLAVYVEVYISLNSFIRDVTSYLYQSRILISTA